LARKSGKAATASGKPSKGFTAEERAAMKARAQELKAAVRGGQADRQAARATRGPPTGAK